LRFRLGKAEIVEDVVAANDHVQFIAHDLLPAFLVFSNAL
jgi:hypothetical protein